MQIIEFDVAVTVAESKQLVGRIGIVVPELSFGYQVKVNTANSKVLISKTISCLLSFTIALY